MRRAFSATTDELEVMGQWLELSFSSDATNDRFDFGSREWLHAPTLDAHQVMVVGGRTDDITMTAVALVHAVERAQLGQQIQRPEHRGAADLESGCLDLLPGLLGSEQMIAIR
jgi:hypothetical protein